MRAYDVVEVSQLCRLLEASEPRLGLPRGMRRCRGLCPRHIWAAAVVEYELDWRPQAIGALGQELLSHALQILTAPGWPRRFRQHALRDRGECPVCAATAKSRTGEVASTDADHAHLQRVNACVRFSAMVERSYEIWAPFTCPVCAGGRGPMCRPHLLELPAGFTREATSQLRGTYTRLSELVATTTANGPARTPATEAGLIETLGFIAGWTDAPIEVISAW